MDIKYTFSTMISVDYYLAHPDMYEKDRNWVLMLNQYMKKHTDALLTPESLNERSFEIWHREKFLDREQGKNILILENKDPFFSMRNYLLNGHSLSLDTQSVMEVILSLIESR